MKRGFERFVLFMVAAVLHAVAHADGVAALLVASERLAGAYRGTVILVAPHNGGHVGVILNRPAGVSMAELFPEHRPSAQVADPVYRGGPAMPETIFALCSADVRPHASAIPMGPGLWLLVEAAAIDAFMEASPTGARYYAGYVGWRPGELLQELEQGMFHLRPLDKSKLFLPDTSSLHLDLAPKKGEVRL